MAVFPLKKWISAVLLTGCLMQPVSSTATPPMSASQAVLTQNYQDGWIIDNYSKKVHSEGMGVGMLAAVHQRDFAKFKSLWANAQKMQRDDFLFAWDYDLNTMKVADNNNATDGDLYIAGALLQASKVFNMPQYRKEAVAILATVEDKLIQPTTHGLVLSPAESGFEEDGVAVINLSYYLLPLFDDFQQATGNNKWLSLKQEALAMLKYAYFGKYQLPPDWLMLTDPVSPWHNRDKVFGYEAIRIPLYVYRTQPGHPVVSRFLQFSRQDKATVNLADDTLAEYSMPPGMRAIKQTLQGKYSYQPTSNYYDNALQVMIETIQ